MVNDFDKEIDAMLRDLAKGDTFAQVLPASHLDADEISAFAENALPKMARVRVTEHLADCSKCRKMLANTIFLNSAEESETIHEEIRTVIAAPAIPWYKSLFAFPNLAYTMGAMALLLVGMVGFLMLQNSNNSNSMVAQSDKSTSEKASGPNLGSSEGDAYGTQPYSANSTANAPAAMATPALTAANSANAVASNKTVSKDSAPTTANSNASSPKATDSEITSKSGIADDVTEAKKDSSNEPPKPVPTPAKEEAVTEKGGERAEVNSRQVQDLSVQSRNNQVMMPDGQNRSNVPTTSPTTSAGASQDSAERERSAPAKPNKKMADRDDAGAKNKSAETRKIGSKSFRNVNGVWTDTSFTGGATQNVKRNSDEFKKLDSGLQNTANSLGGTVIIVWGGKNYKIQ